MTEKKLDPYEILEVEKTCTVEEIKKSYRKLALVYWIFYWKIVNLN